MCSLCFVADVREVPTSNLVPGDVIIIPSNGCIVPCDAVLIVGSAVVDESMLTGNTLSLLFNNIKI